MLLPPPSLVGGVVSPTRSESAGPLGRSDATEDTEEEPFSLLPPLLMAEPSVCWSAG